MGILGLRHRVLTKAFAYREGLVNSKEDDESYDLGMPPEAREPYTLGGPPTQ